MADISKQYEYVLCSESLVLSDINNNVAQRRNVSEVIKNYNGRLKSFIRKRVHSIEDADDILQDVFYQLAEADSLMKPIDQITSWLFTVARNKIIDLYRKKKTESIAMYNSNEDDDAVFELKELLYDEGNTPETEYLRSLVWTELTKALEELPAEQREVFEMHELQDLSFKEIAEKTGESVNTLISRKRYAVLFLRERLQILYDELINF